MQAALHALQMNSSKHCYWITPFAYSQNLHKVFTHVPGIWRLRRTQNPMIQALLVLQADVNLVNILQWANFLPADMAPEGIKTGHGGDKQTLQVSTASATRNGVPQSEVSNGRYHTLGLQQGVSGLSHTNGRHSKAVVRSSADFFPCQNLDFRHSILDKAGQPVTLAEPAIHLHELHF